jgi:hypothetical protein
LKNEGFLKVAKAKIPTSPSKDTNKIPKIR